MAGSTLSRIVAHFLRGTNPDKLRNWAFFFEAGIVGALILGLVWLRGRDRPSGFKVREADLKKGGDGARSSSTGHPDALADARIQRKPEPLRLTGISLSGAPHEILGVSRGADAAEIQKAYRELMKRYHPDKVGRQGSREWHEAQKIAQAIHEAKERMLRALRA